MCVLFSFPMRYSSAVIAPLLLATSFSTFSQSGEMNRMLTQASLYQHPSPLLIQPRRSNQYPRKLLWYFTNPGALSWPFHQRLCNRYGIASAAPSSTPLPALQSSQTPHPHLFATVQKRCFLHTGPFLFLYVVFRFSSFYRFFLSVYPFMAGTILLRCCSSSKPTRFKLFFRV